MNKMARFVLWLCQKFTRAELQDLRLSASADSFRAQPRDDFRQQHPHYRDFYIDPQAPLTQPPALRAPQPTLHWQQLCATYQETHGRPLTPGPSRRPPQ